VENRKNRKYMALFQTMGNIANDPQEKKQIKGDAEKTKVLIIGSGPAGYTAAIYAARANLSPILYQGLEPGGQLTTTTEVENFPGYPQGVTGPVMMEDLKAQAERFGAESRWGIISEVDLSNRPFKAIVDGTKLIEAESIIIATGATAKYLGLSSEEKFKGSGVSACATCDGFFYKGKNVAVVGGGDTAAEEATYLAGLCNKVYLIVRKNYLRASKAMIEKVERTKNIEILYEHTTKEIIGSKVVGGAILDNNGKDVTIEIDGFFVAIGHTPQSQLFTKWIDTDNEGYIKTLSGTSKTNVDGVFACGDVMDSTYKQAITAAGSGCKAALDAEKFISSQE
jgi:thioredoxin reductase (NADPH)